jgi:hypothetical protein
MSRMSGRAAATRPSRFAVTERVAFAVVVVFVLGRGFGASAQSLPSAADLPDWSGAWARSTGAFYESTPEQALEPPPAADSPRRKPPYTPKFDAIYRDNLARIAADRFPDPISLCGTPAGWPRMLALPDAYEFVIRPEQTWLLAENGPNLVRVYTDGRAHPAPEDMWATYTGSNVGRWEKDELVFHSIGLKGVGSTILARTGLVMSDKLETTTRIRLIAPDRLLVSLVLVDSEALTRPWPVAFTYTRLPPGSTVYDYACAENNRNPVTSDGRTLTLDPSGQVIDKLE